MRALRCVFARMCVAPPALAAGASEATFGSPTPRHKVRIERSVTVPMRDGVKLSTDLYSPEGAEGKLPVILVRTPYPSHVVLPIAP